jgi:hypothetical protein
LIAIPLKNSDVSIPTPLTEADFLKTFALITVCGFVAGALVGGMIGGIVGAVESARGSLALPHVTSLILGAIGGLIVNYFAFRFFVMRFIVRKLVHNDSAA